MENLETLTQQLLSLPIDERARLAERLLESLDHLSEEENEKVWAEEALRRVEAYEAGDIDTVSAEEVQSAIMQRFK